ncbi:unnamed protein product [Rotaria sordida]|uniref:Uncharacterized protein n=1 Tax=Rotaria sordida TaxID=392033 RepID=A0A819NWD0_9BILA|nr:unnamed protein product [Rotaria sordida]
MSSIVYVYNSANLIDLRTNIYKKVSKIIMVFQINQLLIKTGKENDDRRSLIEYFKSHKEYTGSQQKTFQSRNLSILNVNIRLTERFYTTLLHISNPLSWIITCHVGFGVIEHIKETYQSALNNFKQYLEILDKENVYQTYRITRNIYREMKYYNETLNLYDIAIKNCSIQLYFIKKEETNEIHLSKMTNSSIIVIDLC